MHMAMTPGGSMSNQDSDRRKRWLLGGLLVAGVLVPTGTMLAAQVTMVQFTTGQPIKAADVNANFKKLADETNRLDLIVKGTGVGNNNAVVGLAAPVNGNDAANKDFVVTAAAGAGGSSI